MAYHHFCGTVELHRTGTERDHRVNQGEILIFQLFHVTNNVRLGVISVENEPRHEISINLTF